MKIMSIALPSLESQSVYTRKNLRLKLKDKLITIGYCLDNHFLYTWHTHIGHDRIDSYKEITFWQSMCQKRHHLKVYGIKGWSESFSSTINLS